MNFRNIFACALACFIAVVAAPSFGAGALIASATFDVDAEGWRLQGDATTGTISIHSADGGNPGGAISGIDQATGGVWRFVAPSAYLGNQSNAYGGSLVYDIKFTFGDPVAEPFNGSFVLISDGVTTLGFVEGDYPQAGIWNTRTVPFTESGWFIGGFGGDPASKLQMQSVLANLTSLRIRGELDDGPDQGFLDNVSFFAAPVPEPEVCALMIVGLGLIGWVAPRRRQFRHNTSPLCFAASPNGAK